MERVIAHLRYEGNDAWSLYDDAQNLLTTKNAGGVVNVLDVYATILELVGYPADPLMPGGYRYITGGPTEFRIVEVNPEPGFWGVGLERNTGGTWGDGLSHYTVHSTNGPSSTICGEVWYCKRGQRTDAQERCEKCEAVLAQAALEMQEFLNG